MSDLAIRVDGIGKKYQIGGPSKTYDRLGDQLVDALTAPFKRAQNLILGRTSSAANLQETFWALKDVSFEVRKGEVLGIVGRNGAGKSTLLKILSRITEPTEGYADIFGRVGSLLEVGTGFHPELTGRENIYLNGAILGMSKKEIDCKMGKIIDFAEIAQFLDTPVKHYSSGMYVRLAFSVAAHLEPEILLVDEVLAVGDLAFQRKCLGKMSSVAKQGLTVFFVSHNMGLIQALCNNGIFLHEGSVHSSGDINSAVNAYLHTLEQLESTKIAERTDRTGAGKVRFTDVEIISSTNETSTTTLQTGQSVQFVFQVDGYVPNLICEFLIFDYLGQPVAKFNSGKSSPEDKVSKNEHSKYICEIKELLLLPGRYRLDVVLIGDDHPQDILLAVKNFDVVEGDLHGRPPELDNRFRITIPHIWTLPIIK
jgi:lipopolysaccharide transport system ATP-binding protein